jgi:hypothetical protein
MKSHIFWDITPCSQLKINQRLRGTCRLHFQGRRISQARNQREDGRDVLLKRRLNFNGLHGVISQKTEVFRDVYESLEKENSMRRSTEQTLG